MSQPLSRATGPGTDEHRDRPGAFQAQPPLPAGSARQSPEKCRVQAAGLFWLAGPQELDDRGRELRFGERGHVVRALDDLDFATAEQLSYSRNPVLHIIGFVPAVDEQDRSLALAQFFLGHFQVLEAAAGRRKRFDILAVKQELSNRLRLVLGRLRLAGRCHRDDV